MIAVSVSIVTPPVEKARASVRVDAVAAAAAIAEAMTL